MHQLILDCLDNDLKAAFQADPGPVALQAALQVQMIRMLKVSQNPPLVLSQDPKPTPNPPDHERVSKRSKERRGH